VADGANQKSGRPGNTKSTQQNPVEHSKDVRPRTIDALSHSFNITTDPDGDADRVKNVVDHIRTGMA